METVSASLDRIAILRTLDADERLALTRQCRWRRFRADEQIIDHLSDTRDVCFVVEGAVRVVSHSVSGREISFDEVEAGGFIGELAAIDGGPRSASVVARDDNTLVAFLAPRAFQELVTNRPELALMLMRRLCAMVRQATERIMDLSTLAANNRVHAELLRLARPNRKPDGTAVITPVPVHGDIAARISATRETVARVMGELTRDGVIEKRGSSLVIRAFDRLDEMVQEVRGVG
ncbi:Crp/Fnr family transcriptional regulator [Azospirillum sp. RWY-5-1]|uniref:Crp/Fnr family transcriptional regulator n=1 Tax=Azospirillum oleiclasticum TaxID=2735135 RepID=A0ABX2T5E4_9PROT|nr:Crp/Fnr family transcriptional regulator [Azospirillum oleiclasticum]NYZ12251.1 Crp/Fnr family transcriptional regulator [Azospirillum oleiclasticum]NYZ19411.1 Crp/Fnr family transcriptional regulator [Azospirillum oleiclasticum]